MLKEREAGFTLVELVIVMAISMSMAVAVFAGFAGLQRGVKFTDSVERVKEVLAASKNEANSTVNTVGGETTSGRSNTRLILGRAVVFMGHGSGEYLTFDIIGTDEDSPKPVDVVLTSSPGRAIPWGVSVNDPAAPSNERIYVAFIRTPEGVRSSFFKDRANGISQIRTDLLTLSNYNPPLAPVTNSFVLSDGAGRSATIKVEVPSGLVTREYHL